MICQRCKKSYPKRTGRFCGACQPDAKPQGELLAFTVYRHPDKTWAIKREIGKLGPGMDDPGHSGVFDYATACSLMHYFFAGKMRPDMKDHIKVSAEAAINGDPP